MKHSSALAKAAFILAASASLFTTATSASAQGLRDLIGDRGESRSDLRDLISDRLASRDDLRDLLRDRFERRKDLRDLVLDRLAAREDLRDLLRDRLQSRSDLRDLLSDCRFRRCRAVVPGQADQLFRLMPSSERQGHADAVG